MRALQSPLRAMTRTSSAPQVSHEAPRPAEDGATQSVSVLGPLAEEGRGVRRGRSDEDPLRPTRDETSFSLPVRRNARSSLTFLAERDSPEVVQVHDEDELFLPFRADSMIFGLPAEAPVPFSRRGREGSWISQVPSQGGAGSLAVSGYLGLPQDGTDPFRRRGDSGRGMSLGTIELMKALRE